MAAYRGQWLAAANPNQFTDAGLTPEEAAKLVEGLDDPKLLGNRIAAFTKRYGLPPCGGCGARQQWLNKLHAWVQGKLDQPKPELEFISTAQLTADTYTLAAKLPRHIGGIIGVARSGMLPATQIAMHLHLPLRCLRQSVGDIQPVGHGYRLKDSPKLDGPLVVVDDTCMSG